MTLILVLFLFTAAIFVDSNKHAATFFIINNIIFGSFLIINV